MTDNRQELWVDGGEKTASCRKVRAGAQGRGPQRKREKGRSEVEVKIHVLAHSVWCKRNRKALLEDTFEL